MTWTAGAGTRGSVEAADPALAKVDGSVAGSVAVSDVGEAVGRIDFCTFFAELLKDVHREKCSHHPRIQIQKRKKSAVRSKGIKWSLQSCVVRHK